MKYGHFKVSDVCGHMFDTDTCMALTQHVLDTPEPCQF